MHPSLKRRNYKSIQISGIDGCKDNTFFNLLIIHALAKIMKIYNIYKTILKTNFLIKMYLELYQVIKDVSLMHMNGNKCFIFHSFHFCQVMCCLFNQAVQHVKESLICSGHNFLVASCMLQSIFCILCPNHLDSKKSNLNKL